MTRRGSFLCLLLGTILLAAAAALLLHNRREVRQAQHDAELLLAQAHAAMDTAASLSGTPETQQPTEECFGTLSIPALERELPVLACWSEAGLKKAPCRQQGSPEEGGMVIAGHNYAAHFGGLSQLAPGDAVTLTAMDGTAYHYAVERVVQTAADDTEAVLNAGEPLVLYTCTYGGEARIAVFCSSDP